MHLVAIEGTKMLYSPQMSRIDAMDTYDLGIPYLDLELGLGIKSRVRVTLANNPYPGPDI